MAAETAWPPKSPLAALLGSPSGRRKYQRGQIDGAFSGSPTRRLKTIANFGAVSNRILERSQNSDREDGEDEEEDEETLQLKLEAIEAKLKLKKLQRNRAKSAASVEGQTPRFSTQESKFNSSSVSQTNSRAEMSRDLGNLLRPMTNSVEVPLSPSKKPIQQAEQRSPGRILLGIDKGLTAADVSLKRAQNLRRAAINNGVGSHHQRPSSRLSTGDDTSSASSVRSKTSYVKSFSEKMAENREKERSVEIRREQVNRSRSTKFNLDHAELDSYRLAAEESQKIIPLPSASRTRPGVEFSREEVLFASHKIDSASRGLKKSRTMPNLVLSPSKRSSAPPENDLSSGDGKAAPQGDPALFEPFSHLNLSSRILPHSFLKRTLPSENFTPLRIPDLLKQVTSPAFELPESVVDFVVFGIVASKSSPLNHKSGPGVKKSTSTKDWELQWEDGSQNQQKFIVLQLCDLKWSLELYLFGTAVPRYHRLTPGTVVAILNPGIMPPKRGQEDTGAFSLTLNSGDDTILEIGSSRDLGFCSAVKKDGKECGTWVNVSKTEICEFHLNLQVAKAQSGRMGLNTGTNGFGRGSAAGMSTGSTRFQRGGRGGGGGGNGGAEGGRGLLPRKMGHHYDAFTDSHLYIASSATGESLRAPLYRPDRTTAQMLDLNDDDDPFIAEGQLTRDKEARMRKRLATQAREREIASKLTKMVSGGAGAEYLKHGLEKAAEKAEAKTHGKPSNQPKTDRIKSTELASTELASTTSSSSSLPRSALNLRADILDTGSSRSASGSVKRRLAENVRLSPVKKTRFVTDKGIKVAGRESLGQPGGGDGTDTNRSGKRRHGNGVNYDDDEDDDLDIV